MGTNLPSDRGPALDWINARLSPWQANAAVIGLEETDVTTLVALAGTADDAKLQADEARSTSKAATQAWYDTADQAMDWARDLILKIKLKAAVSNDPAVYTLAQVSAKADPGEVPPPESPSALEATLLPGGSLRLNWTCRGPRGTYYIVTRKLDGESAYAMIATVADKSFTDNSLPKGVDLVFYQVNAQQGSNRTLGTILPVQLGVGNNQQSQQGAA